MRSAFYTSGSYKVTILVSLFRLYINLPDNLYCGSHTQNVIKSLERFSFGDETCGQTDGHHQCIMLSYVNLLQEEKLCPVA
jgi:hypothetical protein